MVLLARPSGSAPGPITPPRRQRDAGWFRPPHHAHPSRVPLQACAAPHALRRRADGPRGSPHGACPRAAGASFCTCPRRWWSAARRCARRVHDPRKIMRRAIYTRCRALRRSISPRLPGGPAQGPTTRRRARTWQARAQNVQPNERVDTFCRREPHAAKSTNAI